MEAFIKFVTSDRDIPDGELLACLCTVLRCAPKESINVGIQPGYGQVVKHLTTLLSRASSAADVGNQYKVLRALSELLDAMNDFKFHGISDDEIAQPLYNLLKDAGKHDELRLSQAAHYAYQALRGIPTDVGPWNKAGKAIYRTLRTVALLASSVPTMSPEKLLEGGAEALDQLQGAAEMLSDIINELKDTGNTYNGIKNMKGKSQWYLGLRYTDLLIRGSAPKNLENMLNNENFPLKQDKNFLCGLCAQLERVRRDSNVNERMVVVLSDFLREQGNVSKSARVRQWVTLVNVDNFIPGETSKICRIFPHIRYNPRKYTDTIGYQASSIQTLGQELLNRAWESCHEVRLFYADQVIRDHYTKKALKLLEVERVGKNGTLAMDQCYINLAIVESNSAKEGESASSPRSSLGRRPAVPKPEQPRPISLPDLQLRSDNRKTGHPNRWRVLIRGQAGMGKSTLCKRIVYDYIYHDVWADVIDRVIWLPLRHLKAKRMHSYSIKQLLLEYYFDNRQDDPLWETLCKEQDSNESKTLFILDGLDEAIQDSQLLQLLLCQPRVIITSRPYAIDPDLVQDLDLEVQTLGFYPEQMKQYINAVEPGNAVEIQNFLSARPAIHELARIPVQLDAICYSFEAAGFRKGEGPRNMTELYKAIELVMWRKDVVQLEIHGPGRLKAISKTDASGLADAEILPMVQGEINILQALAFDGFFCNRQEFDWQYEEDFAKRRDTLTKCLPEPKYPVASIDFQKISLLRTSDGGRARHNNYHFIHLTYQEYFAAQYFVQHWPCKTLPMVGLSAQDFLLKEKYNKRFDNMWR
ncbi:pfs domain-containing protein, partial [Xylaria flabelliformis]